MSDPRISPDPAPGCHIARLPLGAASAYVEYEYEPAGGDGWEEPHYDASVVVQRVLLNGLWCDVRDVLLPWVIEQWEHHLLDTVPGEIAAANGEAEVEAHEFERSFL